jgi:hypothetical protein
VAVRLDDSTQDLLPAFNVHLQYGNLKWFVSILNGETYQATGRCIGRSWNL